MNEKGKEFIFYNKPYMPSAGLHGPLHMVCALLERFLYESIVYCPWIGPLHAHTVALPAAAWAEGCRGACTQIYSSYSL